MNIKEVYTTLEGMENGADLIAAVKGELQRTRNEAKTARLGYENLLAAVGLEDTDTAVEQAQSLKKALDEFTATGKKPDEAASTIKSLTKQVEDLTKNMAAERDKRVNSTKLSKALAALQAGKAVNPSSMAKLVLDSIKVKDDDSVVYLAEDGTEQTVEDGVRAYLAANPWAVKNEGAAGAGTGKPNSSAAFSFDRVKDMSEAEINQNWDKMVAADKGAPPKN